jgi:ABC-type transport system involved in multi-copper enzyme maturation permease subunit
VRAMVMAQNTFREGVRDRIFFAILVFGALILLSSLVIGPLSLGEQVRITQDIGLASMSILCFLITILIGTGIVYKEIERKTIYTVLSKPVNGWELIVGKFIGLTMMVGLLTLAMAAILAAANWLVSKQLPLGILTAILLVWMELVLLTALSILMSTLCSPILGAIFTLVLYVIGHTIGDIKELAVRFGSPSVEVLSRIVYYTLPNLEYFNIRGKVIHGVEIEPAYVAFACAYALLYALVFLTLATLVLDRKEFK